MTQEHKNTTEAQQAAQDSIQINLYDSMYAYVKNADISHYQHSNADKDAPYILIEVFQPSDDPDFTIFFGDRFIKDDKTYYRVNWYEEEISYLLEEALYNCCYVRYVFVDDPESDYGEYVSDGTVYETQEDAETQVITENLADNEYYCEKCDKVYEYRDDQQQCCEKCNSMIDDDQIAGKE